MAEQANERSAVISQILDGIAEGQLPEQVTLKVDVPDRCIELIVEGDVAIQFTWATFRAVAAEFERLTYE